jgi:outer membrane protein
VLAAHSILTAADGAYERSRVHRDLAEAAVRAGLRPPIELTRAEADLARFEVGRAQARGNLGIAQSVYASSTGVEDAALDAPAGAPAPADLPAFGEAMRRAATADPHILGLLNELRAREQRARAVGTELRPDLQLTATFSGRAGGAPPSGNGTAADGGGWLPRVPNWDVGVVFSWPLFDGVVNARIDAARAVARETRAELDAARFEQLGAIRAGYLQVDVARAALPALVRAKDTAQANYEQADARFRNGLATSVELADAESVRVQAEVQLALGQFALARARAAFGRMLAEGV